MAALIHAYSSDTIFPISIYPIFSICRLENVCLHLEQLEDWI